MNRLVKYARVNMGDGVVIGVERMVCKNGQPVPSAMRQIARALDGPKCDPTCVLCENGEHGGCDCQCSEPKRLPERDTTAGGMLVAMDDRRSRPRRGPKGAKAAAKLIDERIQRAYQRECSGIQINILDIPKVFAAGRKAIEDGADDATLREKVRAFVETIRKN